MPMDFNKFTEKAQEVLMISQGIMQRYQHVQLDTDHLLLAMLEQPDGTVPRITAELGVDAIRLADARERLAGAPAETAGRGSAPGADLPHARRAARDGRTVLEYCRADEG